MPDITDKERLDFLQKVLVDDATYTGKCVLRPSSRGRGWRLHESGREDAGIDVRKAIDEAIINQ